jgi:integrase
MGTAYKPRPHHIFTETGNAGRATVRNWRKREWNPALDAAGVPHRTPYELRHTFATNALAAGINIFELARFMGTSVKMINSTYGRLAQGSGEAARRKLDSFNTERSGVEVASTPYRP